MSRMGRAVYARHEAQGFTEDADGNIIINWIRKGNKDENFGEHIKDNDRASRGSEGDNVRRKKQHKPTL